MTDDRSRVGWWNAKRFRHDAAHDTMADRPAAIRPTRTVLAVGTISVLIVLVCAALIQQWLVDKQTLPIRFVRVEGAFRYLEPSDVKQVLMPLMADAGYFSVALSAVREAVLALPWVYAVRVRRIWPDTLVVRIDEQRPYVRWGNGSLLNERGERFTPENIEAFQELPLLHGQEGEENALFGVLNKLTPKLADNGLRIEALTVSKRHAWTIRLAGGLTIKMGRRHPWRALDRFLRAMPLLKDERRAIQGVDLRYPNGFAVSWKSGIELEWRSEHGSNHRTPRWLAGL